MNPAVSSSKALKPKASNPLAQRLFEADAAFARQDYSQALELYRQVDAIEATVKTRIGIADCQRELGHLPDAYDTYDQLLRERGASLSRKDFERVEQALASLRAATCVLAIQVAEPGARVSVDNAAVGLAPLDQVKRRLPGTVSVTVTKQGFETWSQQVVLHAAEERRIVVTLTPIKTTGAVVVRANSVEPAQLYVDGKPVGALPFTGDLPTGEHVVVAASASGESTPRKLNVTAGGRIEAELVIVAKPASLRITTLDASAVILIDGTPVASGRFEAAVPPGNHVVTIERAGFVSKVTQLVLEPGEQITLDNITLDSVDKPGGNKPPSYEGLYLRLGIDGLLGHPTTSVATACPAADVGGSCKSYVAAGGAVDTRIGYSFGLLAVEAFSLLGTTVSAAQMVFPNDLSQRESPWYGIARNESYLFVNPMVALGAAGRVTSRSQGVRISSSWGAGLAWHDAYVGRTMDAIPSNVQDGKLRKDLVVVWSSGSARILPILIWDAEVELGDTPGTRLLLGLHSQIEFGESSNVNAGSGTFGTNLADGSRIPLGGGDVRPWGSPNFMIGPKVGLIIGH
jgi:hypothetical protein